MLLFPTTVATTEPYKRYSRFEKSFENMSDDNGPEKSYLYYFSFGMFTYRIAKYRIKKAIFSLRHTILAI